MDKNEPTNAQLGDLIAKLNSQILHLQNADNEHKTEHARMQEEIDLLKKQMKETTSNRF
jgi:peptidoglycan hydrolase CwlO-like protein